MILILFGCVFFILGLLGIIDKAPIIHTYSAFGIGIFLCLLSIFNRDRL